MNLTRRDHRCIAQILSTLIVSICVCFSAYAEDFERALIEYSLPAGDASVTLREFAIQSCQSLIYEINEVEGITTQSIAGRKTPSEALEHMFQGTPLGFIQDAESGAFAILRNASVEKKLSDESAGGNPSDSDNKNPNQHNVTEMKKQNTPLIKLIGGFMGLLLAGSNLPAQEDGQNLDDEIYELSPFEISTTETVGYLANSTLAGSRINSDLRDVAASITVLTEEFIDDVGAINLNDVLLYTANTESALNYSNAGEYGTEDNVANNPQGQNRVRGLGAADLTRNFFRTLSTDIGLDAYNVERITVNRGPNSILYGLGNPNGIVNYTSKSAVLFDNSNEVSLRYGSNDDMRGSFDTNRVLIKDKLAVRLIGMKADRGFEQQPAYFKDNRINLVATYKPFKSTTLKASIELINQNQNNPNSLSPVDHVSEWSRQGRPEWDPTTDVFSDSEDYFNKAAGENQIAFFNYDGSPDFYMMGGYDEHQFVSIYQQNHNEAAIFHTIAFSDDSVAPLHKMNLNPNSFEQDLEAYSIEWEQKVVDKLFFNIGYLKESLDTESYYFTRGFSINIDPNVKLLNGDPNPHFGETYIAQKSLDNKTVGHRENDMVRATLTYELDFNEFFADSWARWFGRHHLTALAERQEVSSDRSTYNENRRDLVPYLDSRNRVEEPWQITRIRYLGGTADTRATTAPVVPDLGPQGVPFKYWDAAASSWMEDVYNSAYVLKRHDLEKETVESSAFIWQGYLFDDLIVGTVGWRKDENEADQATYSGIGSDGYVVDGNELESGVPISGNTTSYGLVVHPLSWLSFHYNESENFRPAASEVNMLGEAVGPPSGTGKDWGFSLQLFDNKLYVRTNWYKLEQTNSRMGGSATSLAQWLLPVVDEFLMPKSAEHYGVAYERQMPLSLGDSRIVTTSDMVGEGVEIEVVANPTPSLRLMLNIARQEAVTSHIAPGVTRFLDQAVSYWESLGEVWDGDFEVSYWGLTATPKGWFDTVPGPTTYTYNASEGRPNPQIREWRANVIANYTFLDGALEGWNIGGALRWEDEAAIGYPAITDGDLIVALDVDHPYTDDAQFDLDAWVGYTTYIHEDYRLSVQLNVRNLTRSDGFQAINANSDGTPSAFRIEHGPTWSIQSTLSW